jgi:hypothetical protein
MKKLLLLFILLQSVYSHATYVQINFVDNFEIGIINTYYGSPSEGTATTDSEINTIFENHFVYHCIEDFSSISKIIFADYTGENLESFINDLQNNSNVSKAKVTLNNGQYSLAYADRMYLKLIDITVGNPVNINSNGNIITNNASLNTIFDVYNVKQMQLLIPNKPYYIIYFDGDINLLFNALNDLSDVITAEPIGVPMLLSNEKFITSKSTISPNPFSSTFIITSKEFISEYAVFDISGKQIIKTNSKSELDNQTVNLKTGIYVLELKSLNGELIHHKIVKR